MVTSIHKSARAAREERPAVLLSFPAGPAGPLYPERLEGERLEGAHGREPLAGRLIALARLGRRRS